MSDPSAVIGFVALLALLIWVTLARGSTPGKPRNKAGTRAPGPQAQTQRRRPPAVVHSVGPRRIQGRAYVIDGDTIVIRKVKIRLAGIDAPELDQPYGIKAKWAMVALCKGQTITAELNGETSHDRLVGTCFLPDGRDLAAEIVKQGLALDWAMFSGGRYREYEPQGMRHRLTAVRHLNPSKNYAPKPGQPSQRS